MKNRTDETTKASLSLKKSEDIIFESICYYLKKSKSKRTSLVLFFAHEIFCYFLSLQGSRYRNNLDHLLDVNVNVRFGYRKDRYIFSQERKFKSFGLDFFSILICLVGVFQPVLVGCTQYTRMQLTKDFIFKRYLPIFNLFPSRDIEIVNITDEKANLNSLILDLSKCFGLSGSELQCLLRDVEAAVNDLFVQDTKSLGIFDKIFTKARKGAAMRAKVALIGSGANFYNRTLAYIAFQKGVPVVCVLHNGECGLTDMAISSVDDWSISDIIVGYGSAGVEHSTKSTYIRSLSCPEYLGYTSSTQAYNYIGPAGAKKNWRNFDHLIKNGRGLYVESRLRSQGYITNANTHFDLKDEISWRLFLRQHFPNVCIKTHPKGNISLSIYEEEMIEKRKIDIAIKDYDFVILDNACSSAFTHVALYDIPIILVERNTLSCFTPKGLKYINLRCNVFDSRCSFKETFYNFKYMPGHLGGRVQQDFMIREQKLFQYNTILGLL